MDLRKSNYTGFRKSVWKADKQKRIWRLVYSHLNVSSSVPKKANDMLVCFRNIVWLIPLRI